MAVLDRSTGLRRTAWRNDHCSHCCPLFFWGRQEILPTGCSEREVPRLDISFCMGVHLQSLCVLICGWALSTCPLGYCDIICSYVTQMKRKSMNLNEYIVEEIVSEYASEWSTIMVTQWGSDAWPFQHLKNASFLACKHMWVLPLHTFYMDKSQ